MSVFQFALILSSALQSLAGRGSPPGFRCQDIFMSERSETIKLLNWIRQFRKAAPIEKFQRIDRQLSFEWQRSEPALKELGSQFAQKVKSAGLTLRNVLIGTTQVTIWTIEQLEA
jgi:hypothetical protein